MTFEPRLPDWIIALMVRALLGEIYPAIRLIVVGFDPAGQVLIRFYLDREPTEFDWEQIEIVAVNFDASGGKETSITKLDVDCQHATGPQHKLDHLSGSVYSRWESDTFSGQPDLDVD